VVTKDILFEIVESRKRITEGTLEIIDPLVETIDTTHETIDPMIDLDLANETDPEIETMTDAIDPEVEANPVIDIALTIAPPIIEITDLEVDPPLHILEMYIPQILLTTIPMNNLKLS
jgi:hypothetical protein